jgi:hypothetical protein
VGGGTCSGNGVECIEDTCQTCGQVGQACCDSGGVGDGCTGVCVDGNCTAG